MVLRALCTVLALAGAARAQVIEQPLVREASEDAQERIAGFRVPEGWVIELVAAEPSLANPVCFAFDHDGRTIFVGETFRHHRGVTDIRDHMDWNDDDLAARTVEDRVAYFRKHLGPRFEDFEKACERVRRLRDEDGDGVFEEARVFSDRFRDAAAGIGASLLSYRGDVFYTCIPSLWRMRDEDGDGRADSEVELSTGYGVHVALLGHDLHGLRVGPDGKLYFSIGDRGLNVPLPGGGRIEYPESGAVLRCNLDGSELELFASGLRNPQDLVFDAWGNLFTGDNNSDGGDRARLVHVVEGSDSGWRQAYQWITEPDLRGPWNDEKLWLPEPECRAAYVLPPIANLCDGPSGITIDPGTGFPERYAGWFFLADFRGGARNSGVRGFELLPKGAGFELGRHEETFWRVLATDVDVGTDGALYVLDWVEGWNKTGRGRIYRAYDPAVRASPGVDEVRRLLAEGFDARPERELVALLLHADQRVRQEAQFALVRRGAGERLARIAAESPSRLARVHGIWGLGMLLRERGSGLDVGPLVALTSDPDAEIRAQAARVLGDLRAGAGAARLSALLEDPSARVRAFAALGLARIGARTAAGALVAFAARETPLDPVERHAASFAMSTCLAPADLAKLTEHRSRAVRLAAVVALRRARSELVRSFLADADVDVALEAARAIYDVPIEGALEALAAAPVATDTEWAFARRVLSANFRLGGREHAERVAALACSPSEKVALEALSLLERWAAPPGRDTVVGAWRPLAPRDAGFVAARLVELESTARADADLARAFIRACAANRVEGSSARFAAWALDGSADGGVRAAAIGGLVALDAPELAGAVRAAVESEDPRVRAAGIEHLPRIDAELAWTLAESVLREGELGEQRSVLKALAKLEGPGPAKLVARLIDEQAREELAPELALELALCAEARPEAEVAQRLAALRAPRASDPLTEKYLDSLHGGDVARGRALFREKAETNCVRCHVVEAGGGGEVGPDLRGLAARSTRLAMLESICDPNRAFAEGYRNTIVFLYDETRIEGRVVLDGPIVQLLDAENRIHEMPRELIELRREGLSSMPTDLTRFLSREEMRDLLEFLASL